MNAQPSPHPTDRTLSAYGLGQLDDAAAGSVHTHLEGCPDCRRRVAEVTSDSFLGRLRDANARPDSGGPAVSATDGLSMLDGGAAEPATPPADTLPPGLADHPDYKIVRELGRGGMGVVYLAQNTLMGRREVLKVVGGQLLGRPAILERFQARDPFRGQVTAPQHRRGLLGPPPRRVLRAGHGVRRRHRPLSRRQGQGAIAGRQRLQLHAPGGSGPATRRTSTAWSTATSSRPT